MMYVITAEYNDYSQYGDNMWVEQDDGTTIEKILEVIEIQDDIGIIEYEKD